MINAAIVVDGWLSSSHPAPHGVEAARHDMAVVAGERHKIAQRQTTASVT